MEPEIISALLYDAKGFVDKFMEKQLVESPETGEAWDKLEALLTPLPEDRFPGVLELAADYGARKEEDGFITGFRVGARLMMEILQSPGTGGRV